MEKNKLSTELQYLTIDQARQLIEMFDNPEAYAENFSALKAITRGLYKVIQDTNLSTTSPVGRMFKTVNNLQGILLLNDPQEVERILSVSGLMPDPWYGFRSRKDRSSS